MKPLAKSPNQTTLKRDVVPANLHDVAEQVYEDTLYTMYTVSTEQNSTQYVVEIIASDLVKHTAGNGVKGYWVGIGINEEIIDGADHIYAGYGPSFNAELGDPVDPDSKQETNNEVYYTFYFNTKKAQEDYDGLAYVVIDREGVTYSYDIDMSMVECKEPEELVDPVLWNQTSVTQIKNNYLFGIDLSDAQGNPLPESLFVHYLNSAMDYMQNLLDITISETPFEAEKHDYIRNDYVNWGFIQLDHNPVREIKALRMMYGNRPSFEIPLDWIKLDKLTGQITLFPAAGSANNLIIGQTGMLYGFQSQWDYAPMLWEVDYVAGIDENDPSMPLELLKEAVNKRAACGILNVWGDLIIGAGIANQSVSIDGVSQSIGTTQSAMFGGASARVNEYTKDLKETLLPALRQKFGGVRMVVV